MSTVDSTPDDTPALAIPEGLPDDVAPLGAKAAKALRATLIAAGVAALVLIVGWIDDPRQFYHSYLFGYVFALDIALGALFWVLIHHVSDAGWSVGLRRTFENITLAIAPLAVLFLPILVGTFTGQLYSWYDFIHGPEPEHGTHEQHIWHTKHIFYATPFFLLRLFVYFAVWMAFAFTMRKWSTQQDAVGGAALTRKMQWWSPLGVLLLGLTSTFFAFDVVMSLQYSWFSTIFGVYFWAGGIRGSLSVGVLLVLGLRAAGYLRSTITMEHLHDSAKLMFGFTVFWTYIAFSQYFLIWYGNMPEETQFYLRRRNGAWYEMSMLLPVLYFVVPFFLLLPRANKRNPITLAFAAAWILAMHAYDLYWQVLPVLHTDTIHPHVLDVAAPVTLFGVVVACVLRGFQRNALIPIRDARLNETIGYENETP